jgi:peptidoglycan/LPS O-acetylase OafA/YrhL
MDRDLAFRNRARVWRSGIALVLCLLLSTVYGFYKSYNLSIGVDLLLICVVIAALFAAVKAGRFVSKPRPTRED